jgi:hypothetical protein
MVSLHSGAAGSVASLRAGCKMAILPVYVPATRNKNILKYQRKSEFGEIPTYFVPYAPMYKRQENILWRVFLNTKFYHFTHNVKIPIFGETTL